MIAQLNRIYNRLRSNFYLLFNRRRFSHVGSELRIYSPLKIHGHENISFGNGVRIGDGVWLAALPLTGEIPKLSIGSGSLIGHFNHIYCTRSIIIEKDVLTADRVYISDNSHSYKDISIPIWKQEIRQLKDVIIGEGSWLGENVCIIGASVGKHCIIGANSVVTQDIPDYSVAVGAPARIVKKFNFITQQWEKVL